ncbi:MAG TPA: redoxin domain-containing protein [Terriglobales bacterium]|jgi:peroxiredoxin Q/BCP|nr:redoxin domain-containing protein [Terriglobales bacterium]
MRLLAVALVSVLSLSCSLDATPPLSLLLVGNGESDAVKSVSEGDKAPNFTLPSQDGSSISLDQYRGKWVVLYFYPKDFTQGCTIEAHNFQRDEAQYQAKSAVILGVSLDSSDSHKEFCTKEGLNFKLLSDESAKVVSEYGSLSEFQGKKYAARNTFIIGPDGVVRKIFRGVKPNGHSQEVLVTLGDLQHTKA